MLKLGPRPSFEMDERMQAMTKHERRFPLIADNEPVMTPSRAMNLYGNEDLITNIKGPYQDKFYEDQLEEVAPAVSKAQSMVAPVATPSFEPAEKARQEARADLKKKRQAMAIPDKVPTSRTVRPEPKPTSSSAISPEKGWSAYAQNLRQESYILAELPQAYQEPKNPSTKDVKKNSYDFLKRSQIYNQDATSRQKERRVAQELNLSRFEDLS